MYQSRHIGQCLIESLTYPRLMAADTINAGSCPHGGYFDNSDRRCWYCSKETECRWLNTLDEGADASSMSADELIQVLDIAIGFIDQQKAHHDRQVCQCQTCSWLSDTRHLIKQYRRVSDIRAECPLC